MIGKLMKLLGFNRGSPTAIDPICLMEVDKSNPSGGTSTYQEVTYYFCAPGCKRVFDQEPERYVDQIPPTKP